MVSYNKLYATDRFYFDETPFDTLMQNRIIEVLLFCSNYNRFILEEDGRIDAQLFDEYMALNVRYPPRLTFAATPEEMFSCLGTRRFDLVITLLTEGELEVFDLAREIKRRHPDTPIVALTRFSGQVTAAIERENQSHIDNIFCWLGNASILLAIVKLLEDRMNADHDVHQVGVQTIILVENSVRYYSMYLPIIYRALLQQAQALMREGLNEHQRMCRMRSRPKIFLAQTYEEAIALFERYHANLLGVISDISYQRDGQQDELAGVALCQHIRATDPALPILLQSAQPSHEDYARQFDARFLSKHSKSLLRELHKHIRENYGFDAFVFRMPGTHEEVDRAVDLADFQRRVKTVPEPSLEYHVRHHHISKWLKARAFFSLADVLRTKTLQDFDNTTAVRDYLFDTIRNFRLHIGRGTIAKFDRSKFDESAVLERIGDGSLGGKGRGIAFINTFLKRNRIMFQFEGVAVQIPKTIVLTTQVFETFMEANNLYGFALEDHTDEGILTAFLQAPLSQKICDDLRAVVEVIDRPLAVRSSSLLEDSHHQPFAGVYSTYLIPNNNPDPAVRLEELKDAIRGVFASTYFRSSKSYIEATENLIDEEKMAVLIQEVAGSVYGDVFYPNLSGVARSINYYPMGREKPTQGIANIALGLGRTVVDGEICLRFSPAHPKKVFQLSNPEMALRTTQQAFYGIDLRPNSFKATADTGFNLARLSLDDAAAFPANRRLMSRYDHQNETIRDDTENRGRKVMTFASVLRYGTFPLPQIIETLLEVGSREMNVPVEIEFAVDLDTDADTMQAFKFLQIRPIVEIFEKESPKIGVVDPGETIVTAKSALGHGVYDDLFDVIYVRPEAFQPAQSEQIAQTIQRLNAELAKEQRPYILIGPGRWGSCDPWLGIPVQWASITQARIIVEASQTTFRVDASQGSHFFQNITAFRIAYLTVDPPAKDGSYDVDFLNNEEAQFEDALVRHVRFTSPVVTKIDGRQCDGQIKAVMYKPGV